jgi:hypothetical protein
MPSIWRAYYLRSRHCYYGWRGGSQRILLKVSICLVYGELITSGAGTITSLGEGTTTPLGAGTATSLGVGTATPLGAGAATASGVVAREPYLRLTYA